MQAAALKPAIKESPLPTLHLYNPPRKHRKTTREKLTGCLEAILNSTKYDGFEEKKSKFLSEMDAEVRDISLIFQGNYRINNKRLWTWEARIREADNRLKKIGEKFQTAYASCKDIAKEEIGYKIENVTNLINIAFSDYYLRKKCPSINLQEKAKERTDLLRWEFNNYAGLIDSSLKRIPKKPDYEFYDWIKITEAKRFESRRYNLLQSTTKNPEQYVDEKKSLWSKFYELFFEVRAKPDMNENWLALKRKELFADYHRDEGTQRNSSSILSFFGNLRQKFSGFGEKIRYALYSL